MMWRSTRSARFCFDYVSFLLWSVMLAGVVATHTGRDER